MLAAIRKAASVAAIAAAAGILAGCTVEPAPYTGTVYATEPSEVFVDPYDHFDYYHYGYYHHGFYDHHYGPGYRGGGMHGHG